MRVLVTGAEGFVARHFIPVLQAAGAEVVGTTLSGAALPHLKVPLRALDVTDARRAAEVVGELQPTHIVHLAAVSSVRQSFQDPQTTEDVNLRGTQAVLDAALALPKSPLVLLIGSGDEYGLNAGTPLPELPVSELHPVSPYGVSKKAVEELVERDERVRQVTIRTRSFPHIGPGQSGFFFVPDVVTQIVRAERGQQRPVVGVGNLRAVRDFTDVRDVVRAYWLLLTGGKRGEVYNVCSGVAVSIQGLLEKIVPLAAVPVRAEHDPRKARPVDIPVLVGDNTKLRNTTGWHSEIPLEKSLRDILEYARGQPT